MQAWLTLYPLNKEGIVTPPAEPGSFPLFFLIPPGGGKEKSQRWGWEGIVKRGL